MQRQIVYYVNRRSGVCHLHRDCEALELVPDGALRVWHGLTSALPPFRLCRWCFPPALPDW